MSGGGKGGSTTSQVQIPAWLESAARQNLARADRVAQLGYTPYYGPDVAAMTPMQQAAMQNTNQAASAFGMAAPTDAMAGMPAPQTFAGGVQGYSSAPLYQQSVDALRTNAPGQYNAMAQMFVDPLTGATPLYPFGAGGRSAGPTVPRSPLDLFNKGSGGGGSGYTPTAGTSGGYTGFYDMINGGGAGASGSTFKGGPMSGTLNTVGVRPAGSGGSSSGMGGGK